MAKSAGALTGLNFLARPEKYPPRPVCAVFGDEPYLKAEVIARLRSAVLSAEDADFSFRAFLGDEAEPREVFDELSTVALFGGGPRMAVVTEADKFVSDYRRELEDYADHPSASGVLVLDVRTWPSNTKLYKKLAESGLQIDCSTPKESELLDWAERRAKEKYQLRFAPHAAERLLDIVGPQMGRLEQEIAKLADLIAGGMTGAAAGGKTPDDRLVSLQLVEDTVGGWRAKTGWNMIDAAVEGNAADALEQLDRLLLSGENPIALMGQMASSLRKFAAAARLVNQGQAAGRRISVRQALEQAGFKSWGGILDRAEAQLRQLGAKRAGQLYRWLLEADLALKGSSSSGDRPRTVLEQLIVRMSKPLGPTASIASASRR